MGKEYEKIKKKKVRVGKGEDEEKSVRVVIERKVDSVAVLNHLKHMNRNSRSSIL